MGPLLRAYFIEFRYININLLISKHHARGDFLNANFVGFNWPLRGTIWLAE